MGVPGIGITDSRNDAHPNWPNLSPQNPNRQPLEVNASGNEGRALYRAFIEDQFRQRHLPQPAEFLERGSGYHEVHQPAEPDLVRATNHLLVLSEEFSASPLRAMVSQHAASIPLDQLNWSTFTEIMFELFQFGGMTWERALILFYFCGDVAVRVYRERISHFGLFHNVVEWSLSLFNVPTIRRWVVEHGGWVNILSRPVNHLGKIMYMGACMMGAIAFGVYLYKGR